MRSEFEKLKGISQYIGAGIHFNEELNRYRCTRIGMTATAEILDKCWSVYQHRQTEVDELQKRVDAFKDHAAMLREAAKSNVYTEREQNILLSQADDIDKILGLEQALKGGESE